MASPSESGRLPATADAPETDFVKRDSAKTRRKSIPLNTVVGTDEISAWQPVPGITWVQCRAAEHANRLAKRSDSRLVVRGMAGGYLKTYEFRHPLAWAERLIRRYTRQNHAANARLSAPATSLGAFCSTS